MNINVTELEADCIIRALDVMIEPGAGWAGYRLRASNSAIKKLRAALAKKGYKLP